jgi:hypothetical protein
MARIFLRRTRLQFSQDVDLGNLRELVVQGGLEDAHIRRMTTVRKQRSSAKEEDSVQ